CETWYTAWREIAELAEAEARYVHSMYYYHMAEFMLTDDDPAKDVMYQKMQAMFQQAFPTIKRYEVPFKNGFLPCIYLQSNPRIKLFYCMVAMILLLKNSIFYVGHLQSKVIM